MHVSHDIKVKFQGKGGELFRLIFVNLLLTIVTVGIYYPWAKAHLLRYTHQSTEFAGYRLKFHGTGLEIFKGLLKAFFIIVGIIFIMQLLTLYIDPLVGSIFYVVSIIAIFPYAIHGHLRYRTSRASWNNIHFGYRGNLPELRKILTKDLILTVLSLGIYMPWLITNLYNYTITRIRMGNVQFNYSGNPSELFKIWLKGYLLTFLTLGIYTFWFVKDIYNYNINNTSIEQNGQIIRLGSRAKGGEIFQLYAINFLIVVFTFGFGLPWAVVREAKYFTSMIDIEEGFNPELVEATEDQYKDATGDGLVDMLS